MTTLQWVSTEMRTGKVIADLPDLDDTSGPITLAQTIGRYETVTAGLPLPTAPENWLRATLPGATVMVLLQDDVPVWGAYVNRRTRTAGDVVQLSLVTMEGYLDRRYIGDVTFAGTGQNSIVTSLISSYVATGSNGGIPIRVQVVNGGVGFLRDRTYFDKDDKTVYSALQDLSGVIGGVEWTIGFEHQSNPERYTPVLYVGDRLGAAVTPGLSANATFDIPGSINDFSFLEDYGQGKGANDVMAYSSGQGDIRPQSPRQIVADPNRPTFEHRWTPSSSITEVDTLTGHAQGKLAQMIGGTTAVPLSAILESAPRLNVEWVLGDDVGFQLGGLNADGTDSLPGFPGGMSGIARAVGYQLQLSATPIIAPVAAGNDL